ncbi:MAG: helix-turn-helix domain-containing protein [Paracoccaceae bacterium]
MTGYDPESRGQPDWFTQAELARHWRLSIRTLARWRATRRGPPWFILGGSVRYRRDDVLAFEAAQRRES